MLTDVVLEVGNDLFHAHKVVLAAASPYFKAMFTGGLRESDMNRVKLQAVSATAMARLIRFMYTGTIRVTEHTVCQLLPAATMLQVRNLTVSKQNACAKVYRTMYQWVTLTIDIIQSFLCCIFQRRVTFN